MVHIAQEMGISVATVSRALRPETAGMVRESTRRKILDLADRLRFVPNPGARILQKGLNPTLTVVIPADAEVVFSEYYGRLMSGVLHAAGRSGWEVRITTLLRRGGTFVEALRHQGQGSSGIIYAGLPLSVEDLDGLKNYRRPLVLFRSSLPPGIEENAVSADVLGVDNAGGAEAAVDHLVALGHRRIGVISGPVTSRDFQERLQGFRRGLFRHGLSLPEEHIQSASYDLRSGRTGCQQLLRTASPPTAILCGNDYLALGALDFAKEAGLSCPRQISLMGFDDGPWALSSSPALTTMRQPLQRLTSRAVARLIAAATGAPTTGPRRFSADLVVRESTAPPPRRRARIVPTAAAQ